MDKEQLKKLKEKGFSNNQATAILKAQQGVQAGAYPSPYPTNYPSIMNNYESSPYLQRPAPVTEPDFSGTPFNSMNYADQIGRTTQENQNYLGSQYQFSDQPTPNNPTKPQQQYYNDISRYSIINPYSGVDLEGAVSYAGQGFGSGNGYQAGLGTGLSVLKGARNFLTGYSSAKESQRVKEEQYNDLYNPKINYAFLQQGGSVKAPSNAEMLTGQYVTDEGQGNYVLEGGEYLKRAKTGDVQEVIGEAHIKNGKVADGVNVNLDNGDKVLSDYTKIPAKSIKELKDRYDLKLRKNATFADAQKAYDKRLGIQKETDSLTTLIEKFGKNSTTPDETTKRLNDVVLSKEISTSKEKLDLLSNPQAMMFEDLFRIQEAIPKKGKPGELLDDKGKVIEETKNVAQQGGEIEMLAEKFNISPQRAQELIMLQEGGQPAQQTEQEQTQQPTQEQVMQFIAQSLQNGLSAQQVSEQLTQNLYTAYQNAPDEKTKQYFLNSIGINF